jgi:RHS repeat-associated protein
VNGGGFCCDDAPALRAGAIGNGNDNPEIFQYYYHSDHLGSTSLITNLDGEIVQHVEYVPFGEVFIEERNNTWNTPYLFNAKELDEETGLYYYGARYYDSRVSIWLGVDPMWEKYSGISVYAYCSNNPVKFIDPDGREVRGITKQDAQNFRDDIHKVLADDKFANVRALIDVKGKTFKSIDADALSSAMEGLTLTYDESAYITMITGAINSKDVHKVEYVSGDFTSAEGAEAFVNHMNNTLGNGMGDKMATPDGKLSSAWVRNSGDGLNVPTKNGSHSFIGGKLQGDERAVTSGHEVFGHGIPAARKLTPAENNANAIRTDNLIRRLLGLPQRDGSDHGGYPEGHITNPYVLPITQ